MTIITKDLLQKFLLLAGDRLDGDWILIGGTILPILNIDYRVTMDIDLIGKTEKQQSQNIELMDIAIQLGLPVETINQAGSYFLSKIENFENNLIEIYKGKGATIFRPDLFLFLKLKLARLNETDQMDCIEYIKYSKKNDQIDHLLEDCVELIEEQIQQNEQSRQRQRLEALLKKLKEI